MNGSFGHSQFSMPGMFFHHPYPGMGGYCVSPMPPRHFHPGSGYQSTDSGVPLGNESANEEHYESASVCFGPAPNSAMAAHWIMNGHAGPGVLPHGPLSNSQCNYPTPTPTTRSEGVKGGWIICGCSGSHGKSQIAYMFWGGRHLGTRLIYGGRGDSFRLDTRVRM